MGEAVIVSAARTAIGTARKGSLAGVERARVSRHSMAEALKRSGIPTEDVDDIQLGESLQGGGDIARHSAVALGIGEIPGIALNRHCAPARRLSSRARPTSRPAWTRWSSPGVPSPSAPRRWRSSPTPTPRTACASGCRPVIPRRRTISTMDMSITVAWNTAQKAGVTREQADEWAYHSHMRAIAAIDEGYMEPEIVLIEIPRRRGRHPDLRHRRASAARHVDGEAGVPARAPPRDRGFLGHRREQLGPQRRQRSADDGRRRVCEGPRPQALGSVKCRRRWA